MAKLKEIHYLIRATVQPRPYESIVVEYGEIVEPAQGDNTTALRAQLIARCKQVVEAEVLEIRRDANPANDFDPLPIETDDERNDRSRR